MKLSLDLHNFSAGEVSRVKNGCRGTVGNRSFRERVRRRRFISRSRNLVNVSRHYYENVIRDVIDYPIALSTPLPLPSAESLSFRLTTKPWNAT